MLRKGRQIFGLHATLHTLSDILSSAEERPSWRMITGVLERPEPVMVWYASDVAFSYLNDIA